MAQSVRHNHLQKVRQQQRDEGGLWGLSRRYMQSARVLSGLRGLGFLLGHVAPMLCQHLLRLQLQLQQRDRIQLASLT